MRNNALLISVQTNTCYGSIHTVLYVYESFNARKCNVHPQRRFEISTAWQNVSPQRTFCCLVFIGLDRKTPLVCAYTHR